LALVAAALAQSTDHIAGFLRAVRAELGFYIGCLNLAEAIGERGARCCFPEPVADGAPALTARALYDLALRMTSGDPVVANDLDADGAQLVVVTGANRGGKSTFLRSLGQAQLMMQAGMFVAADVFRADVRAGPFTHFKREEDASMRSGKLDEELGRMSQLVDELVPDGLVLLNESFASTNEREGSEIARQIVRALLDAGVKVGYVTHMYDLAASFVDGHGPARVFLRAEREEDGRRTFRVRPGDPEPTSYGEDVYRRVFGAAMDGTS
jgi:DNA mismatch repair ATPase MutS